MKPSAFLIGPFLGELQWEYMYFAPYVINLVKNNPKRQFIVFTRPSRFDLYGQYVDIFVPLRIVHDKPEIRYKFKIEGFNSEDFNVLMRAYINKYKKRFKIIEKIHPDISAFMYKVKWQFPRDRMDYNFRPRKSCIKLARKFIKPDQVLFDAVNVDENVELDNYDVKHSGDYAAQVTNLMNPTKGTTLGCFIEAIKRCQFVIGNLQSDTSKLALLLKKPLISINERMSDDAIHLINPHNTPVIKCDCIKEGIKVYEDNIRSAKCGSW